MLDFSLPTVLPGDDVVDGEREESVLVLMNAAVLAAIARPFADEPPQGGIHQAGRSLRSVRALD